MSRGYKYWTHGVNVFAEESPHENGASNGLSIVRKGGGAWVRQHQGTSNWFHLPIPSTDALRSQEPSLDKVFLRVNVNNNATIDRLHVRDAQLPGSARLIYSDDAASVSAQEAEIVLDLSESGGPICLSIHVNFDGPDGVVVFYAAGALFWVRD